MKDPSYSLCQCVRQSLAVTTTPKISPLRNVNLGLFLCLCSSSNDACPTSRGCCLLFQLLLHLVHLVKPQWPFSCSSNMPDSFRSLGFTCYGPGLLASLINQNWSEARQEIQARLYRVPCCSVGSESKQQMALLLYAVSPRGDKLVPYMGWGADFVQGLG